MQVRVLTAALALACAFAFTATVSTPASAYVGPKRQGDQCWKPGPGPQGIGHWEACPTETKSAGSGRSHSKRR